MNESTREALELTEAAALGAAILSADARAGIVGALTPDAFLREAHRAVFEAVAAMHAAGEHVDQITVNDQLASTGKLDEVGGLVAVFELTDPLACPSPAAWPTYATIVAREARRRRGIRTLQRAIERLEAGEDPAIVSAELAVSA